jgi:hypothetical protein
VLLTILCGALLLFAGPAPGVAQTAEDALLRASNAESGDVFGWAVSIDGDRALVGARNEAGPLNETARAGAVYAFERTGTGWEQQAVLRAPNAGRGDRFGQAVALEGDRAVVGAYLESGPSDSTPYAGAAYVFERDATGAWQHAATLRADNAASGHRFGYTVGIEGRRVIVGAWYALDGAGAAYVFEPDAEGHWTQSQMLQASNGEAGDRFGLSVAIDDGQALVGAIGEAGPDNSSSGAGASYLFEEGADGTWQEARILRAAAPGEGDLFGWTVAIEGDRAVVGGPREDGPSDGMRRTGAAYVYERVDGAWPATETTLLRAPEAVAGDEFGSDVALRRNRLLVGAPKVHGPPDGTSNSGVAYLFEDTPAGWKPTPGGLFYASNADEGDNFGRAVALADTSLFVGTLSEDGENNARSRAGAAYGYTIPSAVRPPQVALTGTPSVSPTEAVIEGVATAGGAETTVRFEYREAGTVTYTGVTADQSPVSGTAEETVSTRIRGLTPGTEYDVRLTATNSAGADTTAPATLVTPPAGPASPYARTVTGVDENAVDAGWRMLAQPAAGTVRAALEDDIDFTNRFSPILYRWDGSRWVAVDASSDALPRGDGFILYFFDDAAEPLDAEGITLDVARGAESPTVDATVDGLSQETTVHLLGNPYEAAVDLDSLAGGDLPAAGFQATVQVWNPQAERYEQLTQGLSGNDVPAWQGFFLERSVVGAGQTQVTFGAGGRRDRAGTLIGTPEVGTLPPEPKRTLSKAEAEPTALAVQVALADATGETVSADRARLWIDDRARTGYDGYEARDLAPPAGGRYVTTSFPIQHNGRLVHRVQAARPPGPVDDEMPLSVRAVGTEGTATLSWPDSLQDRLPDAWAVTLEDTHTGATVDLRAEDYSFALERGTSIATAGAARFRLRVQSGTLPVELTSFEGTAGTDGIELRWTTAAETNNAGFRVLRRVNEAGGTWRRVGTVDGAGTTETAQSYQFTDADPPYAADSLSYRLEQMDTDGTAHPSAPVTVRRTAARVTLEGSFPNPARGRATVRFSVPDDRGDEEGTLRLFDVLGRQVRTVAAGAITGRQERSVDVSGLSPGLYLLQLEVGSTTRTQRMTVLR